jgi:hypothetical protein
MDETAFDFLRVRRAILLEHVEVGIKEGLGDDIAGDASTVTEEENAAVDDERKPWNRDDVSVEFNADECEGAQAGVEITIDTDVLRGNEA